MKKILAWVLVLVLVVGMFAGCGCTPRQDPENPSTEPSVENPTEYVPEGANAEEAMKYLRAVYKDTEEPTPTPVNYERYGIVRIAGIPFTVVWTVDVSEDLIKIVVNDDGTVTIDVNEACEVATPYTLTATITDAQGNTASHSWDMILPAAVDMVEIVKTAYELESGESLPYQSTLRGKIVSINTVYSAEYKNITVTIAVEGAEDMPIMCYRLKGEGIEDLLVGNIITVTGTLKNYNGTIEFDAGCTLDAVEQGDAVAAITDPGEILKAAYALAQDTQLPNPATLTGTVTEIDSPYDPNYGNISVVIEVEGYPQYPILCYRMKGNGVDKIAVNDLITVSGIIKNYKGTVEFDAGCQMTNRVSGGGVAQGPSSDANKILSDASQLAVGEKLPYLATLTGEIYSVDTPYSSEYNNVTVTMIVNGQKIQCFRMIGDGVDQIRETDTITVTGIIENYNGKLEFGAKCNLDSWTKGPRNVNYGPLKEETAYRLYVNQKSIEKTLYFNGEYSGSRLSTSTKGSEGVDIFVERVSGKGVRFYFMDGSTKTYIGVEDYTNDEGKVRGRTVVGANANSCWTYDSTLGVYVVTVQAGKHFLGTYSTYETISASWTGYIDGTMSGSAQYIAKFMLASDVPADDAPALAFGTYTTSPEVGVAYKLGLDQTTKEATYYFTGAMSTYYGATDTDYSKGVDVYLEEADGGYYLYFMDGETKQYVYIVANGTHINFTFEASNKSVFTYDTELNSLCTTLDGKVYYMGTYGSYVTVGTTAADKAASSYVTHLYTSGTGGNAGGEEGGEEGGETVTTPTVVDTPVAGTAYKFGMIQKNVSETDVYYLVGGMASYYMATGTDYTAAIDVYLEETTGGYYMYTLVDGTKTYINMVVKGTYVNGAYETTASTVYTYDAEAKTVIANVNGADYWFGTRNDNTYTTVGPCKTSYNGFYMQFYTVPSEGGESGGEEGGEEGGETVTTPTVVDTPVAGTAYKFGMIQKNVSETDVYYLVGGMASYYMATGTDYTAAIDVYLEETTGGYYMYTLVDSAKTYINMVVKGTYVNGAYETTASTVYTYDAEAKTVIANVNGADYWFGTRNDNTYTTVGPCKTSYNGFYMQFYTVPSEGGETPEEPETPVVPETGVTANLVTELPKDGDVIIVYNSGNAMTATASGKKLAGEEATVTDGKLPITETMAQLTVAIDANGYYTFTVDGKYLTSGETGNALSLTDAASDYSLWTVEAATDGTWYIKNVNAQYNGNVQSLEYYSGFTTYGHKETAIYQMQLFAVPAEPQAPAGGQLMTTAPAAGDVIAIVNGTNAMTATASGKKLAGEEATVTDGVLTLTDTLAQLTVAIDANGYYTFTVDGKYLTSGETGNALSLTDAASDYSLWTVEAATDGTWYIKNVNAQYNGNVQSLEYYSGFTTYGHKETAIYQMQLYKIGTGSVTPPAEDDSTEDETPEAVGVTLTFDDTAKRTSVSDEQQVWQENGITFTNDKAASTSNVNSKYYAPVRCYKGSSIKIEYTGMTKIVFDCSGLDAKYVSALTDVLGEAATEENGLITVVFETAQDVYEIAELSVGQVRINSITVYTASEDAAPTVITIAEAREAETGTEVTVSGVVARITYAFGMKPSGVILVDDTSSIYVYDSTLASQCAIGNTVTVTASKTYWVLESEQTNAAKYGYKGCNQLENAEIVDLDTSVSEFPKSWIEETTVKEILDTPVTEDITTKIYKVTAQVKKVEGTGFTNYYINDLDGATGTYSYSQCSGSDYAWLDAFDGKICTVYVTALNAKSSASGCIWRFLPVAVVDEGFDASTVNFAENAVKYYGVPQFLSTYSGNPALELLTSADNATLGYTGAKLSYTSSDATVISIDENVMNCHKTGTATITVTGEHNGVTYSEDVTITVEIVDINAEYPTVADAIAASVDSTVTVKGIVGPSLVNQDGFYLIDETGIIAVLTDTDTLAALEVGYEVVLEGTRYYKAKNGTLGNTCIKDATVLVNGYGAHAYSTASFDGTLTLAEFKALDVNTDYTTSVFTVTATVEVVETAYYTSIKLVDGDTSVNLYSSSANQYSWLKQYAGQEITMELAPCNWSSKSTYPACVLAVLHADGTKTVNTLNFN